MKRDVNGENPWIEEQLRELCRLMLRVLDEGLQKGFLDEEEYRCHIRRKKEFLEKGS